MHFNKQHLLNFGVADLKKFSIHIFLPLYQNFLFIRTLHLEIDKGLTLYWKTGIHEFIIPKSGLIYNETLSLPKP